MTLSPESDSLSPLPPVLSHGLVAVTFFGFVSFLFSTSLFLNLTYRIIVWRFHAGSRVSMNQYLVLIYNLVIADMNQSFAFLLNVNSLRHNAVQVGTSTCWAQGWFLSTGGLSSSVFVFAIAAHTFLAIVKNRRLPGYVFYPILLCLWVFVYAMAITGLVMHPNDTYVRAGAWCWVNINYEGERLWLHYFWMFVALFGTALIYGVIYITLRARSSSSSTPIPHSATPLMIIYPTIYIFCTIPLAGARIASMTGYSISLTYFCVAGSMIACNGWLDALLYSFTRHSIIFTGSPPGEAVGIETFWGLEKLSGFGTTTIIEAGALVDAMNPTGVAAGRGGKPGRNVDHVRGSDSTENLYVMGRMGAGARGRYGSDGMMGIKTETTVHVQCEVDESGLAQKHAEEHEGRRQHATGGSQEQVGKASWETRSGRSFNDL